MKRAPVVVFACVAAAACFNFDALEREALGRLDGGVAGGSAGGGAAGGDGSAGGDGGGAAGGGSAAGDGGLAGGGVGGGGAPSDCESRRCVCACQDGGCRGQCTVEPLQAGTRRSLDVLNLRPAALATTGHFIAVIDAAAQHMLKVFDGGFEAPPGLTSDEGTFKTLDARHGQVLAVFTDRVMTVETMGATVGWPVNSSFVDECLGGAIYRDGSSVQRVAACRLRDGGLGALAVDRTGLTGTSSIRLPVGFRPTLVQVRPDADGAVGRYLIAAEDGGLLYRSFSQGSFLGSDTLFFANQAIVASSEAQAAVIAAKTDQGVRTYRGLQSQPSLDLQPSTQVSNGLANLRSFTTFVPEGTARTEVFVLQRNGAGPGLSFRNFGLDPPGPSNRVNDWVVVVDRPDLIRAYNLGSDVESAFVAPFPADTPDAGVLLVARCRTPSSSTRGLCASGEGTYFEYLPVD